MKRYVARAGRCRKTGKVRYRDEHSANLALRQLTGYLEQENNPDRDTPIRTYPCEFCKDWHFTSVEERPR